MASVSRSNVAIFSIRQKQKRKIYNSQPVVFKLKKKKYMLIVFHMTQDENKNKAHQKPKKKTGQSSFFQPLDTHNSLKDGHGRKALNYAVSLHTVHIFSFGAVFSKWIRK